MATPRQLELLRSLEPMMKKIVNGIHRNLPRSIERDDVLAAGWRGLWDAILRGNTEGDGFEYYARVRIRGAIIDELRTQDWLPRRTRDRDRSLAVVSTEGLSEQWECFESRDPVEAIDRERVHERVAVLLFQLPERERYVIGEHYVHGRKMHDVAAELGVTQARVSQLHARALNRLRSLMTGEPAPHAKASKPRAQRGKTTRI